MRLLKILSPAVFLAFLCFLPSLAFAVDPELSRLIDIPNVENDTDGFSEPLREAISAEGHVVFSEDDMNSAAAEFGIREGYWSEPALIKKANERIRHDALIRFVHNKSKKASNLVFYIYNAYTGELLQDFELKTQKRGKLSTTDKQKIVKAVNAIVTEINPDLYPSDIYVHITSSPEGAEVMRNGLSIGTTPLEYKMPQGDTEQPEQWVLTYPGREPVIQNVSVARSANYNVNIPAPAETAKTKSLFEDTGKIPSGYGRPIFSIGFNVSPTIRRLSSSDKDGKSIFGYRTQVFATYSFDVEFFPMVFASDIDYLQGLGITASVGFGFLDSSLQIRNYVPNSTKCTLVSTNGTNATIRCDTNYVRANVDLLYRLLLNKKDDGKLDPYGMYIDFLLGYAMSSFTLDDNSLYLGHAYHAVQIGTKFSTPLGLPQFRLDLGLDLNINADNGGNKLLKKWGSHIGSSIGMDLGLALSYDIYKGIFVRAGYNFTYDTIQYEGNGCLNAECSSPVDASSKDYYHEIMLGFGYSIY